MKKHPVFSIKKPSSLIEEIVCDAGTTAIDCEHCGRVHFNSDGEYMENGELADFEKKHKSNPEKYIPNAGQIHWGRIEGKQTVIGCPCNVLTNYEEVFWGDRFKICEYIRRRAEEDVKIANDAVEKSKSASKAIAKT